MPERATGYAPSFYSPPPLAGEDGWGAACGHPSIRLLMRGSGSGGRSPATVRHAEGPSPNLSRPAGEGFSRTGRRPAHEEHDTT